MTIKGNLPVEFGEFQVPKYVQASHRKAPDDSVQYVPLLLAAVPDDVFNALVEQWLREIYEQAQKQRPPSAA